MSEKWNQEIFNEFISLRDSLKEEKKIKRYEQVISLGQKIIELDSSAAFLQILTPKFLKEIGSAYLKLNNKPMALKYFQSARDGYIEYRSRRALNKPEDFLKDIASLEKSILKLSKGE